LGFKICRSDQKWSCLALFLCITFQSRFSSAADWDINPSILVAGSYYDNIFLSPPGEEVGDYVGQLNPGILIRGNGRQANLELNAVMQNVFYEDQKEFNDTFWQLNGRGDAVLIPELFFIDATVGYTQQIITNAAPIPTNNITISPNRTNVGLASVNPYFKKHIGRNLVAALHFGKAWVNYSDESLIDNTQNAVRVQLRSTEAVGRILWGLTYDYRKIEPDNQLDSSLELAIFDIDYELSRQTGLLAGGGYEYNLYDQIDNEKEQKGAVWFIGIRWTPSRLNILNVRIGERAFGRSMFLNWDHIAHNWRSNISYTEEPSTSGDVLINNQVNGDVDEPIVQAGDPVPSGQVFLYKRFNLNTIYDHGKTRFELNLYHTDTENQNINISDDSTTIYGGTVNILWRIQPRTGFTIGGNYENQELAGSSIENNLWYGTAKLEHQMSRDMNIWLEYGHYVGSSPDPGGFDYVQNQATLGLYVEL
jgi:hypothetical protein